MPGRWQEPFGFVALQAAQMGRPILASRIGGVPEIVSDGTTGKLFGNEDLPALIESLQLFLDHPALGQQMGQQAYEHTRKNFSFESMVDAYENLYVKIAKR